MNAQQLAEQLNGRTYGSEITKEEEQAAKSAGLVVVYGASDDLVEFYGAIDDEYGCYGGGIVYVDSKGALPERDNIDSDDDKVLADYFQRQPIATPIRAIWSAKEGAPAWSYQTEIPHATFDVLDEDGDLYCRGIVFALADLQNSARALIVPTETLQRIRRDLDACQRVIHYAGGFDPAYVRDAQARLAEIDELLESAPAAQAHKPKQELRTIVTEAMVGMIAAVTGTVPPSDPGSIPPFVQSAIDRAVERITAGQAKAN